jgi:hypothetical protein
MPFQVAFRRCRGDMGGGRDGVPHPLGYRAVMMASARAHSRFGAAGPAGQRRKAPSALIRAEFSGAFVTPQFSN